MSERTDAARAEALLWCGRILDALHHVDLADVREADGGVCDDCRHVSRLRWTFGRVTLCRGCVYSRRRLRPRGTA